jgi:hypothetical protein
VLLLQISKQAMKFAVTNIVTIGKPRRQGRQE